MKLRCQQQARTRRTHQSAATHCNVSSSAQVILLLTAAESAGQGIVSLQLIASFFLALPESVSGQNRPVVGKSTRREQRYWQTRRISDW